MKAGAWNVDEKNRVELKTTFTGKYRVLLNGTVAADLGKVKRGRNSVAFTLLDGRDAEMTVVVAGLYPEKELRVAGNLYLSELELKSLACRKCGKKLGPADKFCEKCGTQVPAPEVQTKIIKLRGARSIMAVLSGMFLFFGIVMYSIQENTAKKSLENLSGYQDGDAYPKILNGKRYTVGELRAEIKRGPLDLMAANGILAVLMFGLYLYAKRSPLVAFLMAAGIFAAVTVLNAIVDPKTIGQGIPIKILVVFALARGIQAALELRKIEG